MASGRKDYFRHSAFAHTDEKIQMLIENGGFDTYGKWWALLELCCQLYTQSGEKETFTFHPKTLINALSSNRQGVEGTLQRLAKVGISSWEVSGKFIVVRIPKFSKFVGKYAQETPKSLPTKSPNKKKRKEKKRNNKTTSKFDFELVYKSYPRQDAAFKTGMKGLKKQIKTQVDYELLETAVENYKSLIEADNIEDQFVKGWNKFTECWRHYAEMEKPKTLASYFEKYD